jgi:plasmid stability protein
VRRTALLALLLPLRRGAGDFARYAEALLEEREFFIRKAIGWVLRETSTGARSRRALARPECLQYACTCCTMQLISGSITIRDVPDDVRDELAARAALAGRSLQEHLRAELIELARRPSAAVLIERIRARKAATGSRLSAERIARHRSEDRR